MILNNVKLVGNHEPVSIRVGNGKIAGLSHTAFTGNTDPLCLTFADAIVFPGLINSHDHLDFNLFPQLGDKTYSNYTEWGNHIHKAYKNEIAAILKIPALLRSEWGVFKNLLCGVTTVINHGERSGLKNNLLTIFEESHCLHSVQFEKYWKLKLNNPLKSKQPVNIHAGEGDDWLAHNEINELIKYNLLQRRLIATHAVAMSESQAQKFEALIWCPESNYFLLDKTAPVDLLKKHSNILFGTDSTLTSTWNIWNHLQVAQKTKLLTDAELYASITNKPAKVWGLNSGELTTNKDADLVVAKNKTDKPGFDSFFSITPADILLIMHNGNIRLFDEEMLPQLGTIDQGDFSKIYINGACKYVQGNLPGLMKKIRAYQPKVEFPVNIINPAYDLA
jgi:cytosine/adenosine deaminase-related metal-dependent hydrolase